LLVFLVIIFGIAMIACDTGGNGGNEEPGIKVPEKEKYEGPVWTAVDDSPFYSISELYGKQYLDINAIAFGGGKFVAVGENGKAARSNDGITWTAVDNGPFGSWSGGYSKDISSIAYGNGIFVVGGAYGRIAWSDDGEDWAIVDDSKFGSETISAIAYGGEKFVAGGSSGKIAWSNDGKIWAKVDDSKFGSDDSINAIAFAVLGQTGRFIAAGTNGKMAWSQSDAVQWSTIADTSFGSESILGITYGGEKFVAVGSSSHVAWSDFGQSWIGIEKLGNSLSSVVYGDGKFVACGPYGLAISPDGKTWTDVPDEYNGNIPARAIAYGNGKFVIGGWDGKIAYSD
jgi:hypothetical protein